MHFLPFDEWLQRAREHGGIRSLNNFYEHDFRHLGIGQGCAGHGEIQGCIQDVDGIQWAQSGAYRTVKEKIGGRQLIRAP